MIKYIIHTGDIHIRNHRRLDEYQEKLEWFIEEVRKFVTEHSTEEVRVVIVGDIFHSNADLSPECYAMASWFLSALDEICQVIVVAGNHDITKNNDRLDPLTALFSMCQFKQTYYLDKETDYQSDTVEDDNIVWCLYSIFDNFAKPAIDDIKINNPDKLCIGLFHGEIKSAKTDAGYQSNNGLEPSYFEDIPLCLAGHIHKRQNIRYEDTIISYCGSLIQQDHGENLSNHGFLVWNVDTLKAITIENQINNYGFYTFKIKNVEDITNNNEELINL